MTKKEMISIGNKKVLGMYEMIRENGNKELVNTLNNLKDSMFEEVKKIRKVWTGHSCILSTSLSKLDVSIEYELVTKIQNEMKKVIKEAIENKKNANKETATITKYAIGQIIFNHGDMANDCGWYTIKDIDCNFGTSYKVEEIGGDRATSIPEVIISNVDSGDGRTRIVTKEARECSIGKQNVEKALKSLEGPIEEMVEIPQCKSDCRYFINKNPMTRNFCLDCKDCNKYKNCETSEEPKNVLDLNKIDQMNQKIIKILGSNNRIILDDEEKYIIKKNIGSAPFVLYYQNNDTYEKYTWFHGVILTKVYNFIMNYKGKTIEEELKYNKENEAKKIEAELKATAIEALGQYIMCKQEKTPIYEEYSKAIKKAERIVNNIPGKPTRIENGINEYKQYLLYNERHMIVDKGNFTSIKEAKRKLNTLQTGIYYLVWEGDLEKINNK